ncbi:hypothetical protein T484DRAFT_3355800 [Baffinella frigidus]|nr:hypothetical protein T484DRAFT_3355800 [Cryptophyta sp. CCMP2293]
MPVRRLATLASTCSIPACSAASGRTSCCQEQQTRVRRVLTCVFFRLGKQPLPTAPCQQRGRAPSKPVGFSGRVSDSVSGMVRGIVEEGATRQAFHARSQMEICLKLILIFSFLETHQKSAISSPLSCCQAQ